MEPVLKICAGMDVHEKKVDVCIAYGPFDKPPKFEIRNIPNYDLGSRRFKNIRLKKCMSRSIGMESTGVYWKPIFNVMEGEFKSLLANAQRSKLFQKKDGHHGLQANRELAEIRITS